MAFAPVTAREAIGSAVTAIGAAGSPSPRLDAEVLLAWALGVDRAAFVRDPDLPVQGAAARRFRDAVGRRSAGREPVAYIVQMKGFRHLDLYVDPRVLIPRPETEHLVEAVLALAPDGARVADVGTGSGAVALALKHERPDLRVVGTDVSAAALDVARANAQRLDLDVAFAHGDLLDGVPGPVDVVAANPPYVPDGDAAGLAPEITAHEPAGALYGGPDGLDVVRRLVGQAADRGVPAVALEIGAGQAAATAALLREAGYPAVRVHADLAGIDRVVEGRR